MVRRRRTGPAIDGAIRRTRIVEQGGDRLDNPNSPGGIAEQARRVVDDFQSNGAVLTYRAGAGDLLPSFSYQLQPGGDRQRCRALITEAKSGSPLLWAAVLQEIAKRTSGAVP